MASDSRQLELFNEEEMKPKETFAYDFEGDFYTRNAVRMPEDDFRVKLWRKLRPVHGTCPECGRENDI